MQSLHSVWFSERGFFWILLWLLSTVLQILSVSNVLLSCWLNGRLYRGLCQLWLHLWGRLLAISTWVCVCVCGEYWIIVYVYNTESSTTTQCCAEEEGASTTTQCCAEEEGAIPWGGSKSPSASLVSSCLLRRKNPTYKMKNPHFRAGRHSITNTYKVEYEEEDDDEDDGHHTTHNGDPDGEVPSVNHRQDDSVGGLLTCMHTHTRTHTHTQMCDSLLETKATHAAACHTECQSGHLQSQNCSAGLDHQQSLRHYWHWQIPQTRRDS